jgi:hypothetical protein
MLIKFATTAALLLGLFPIVAAKKNNAAVSGAVAVGKQNGRLLRGLSEDRDDDDDDDDDDDNHPSSGGWCWEEHNGYISTGSTVIEGHEGTDYFVYLFDGSDGSHYNYYYEYSYQYGYENHGGGHMPSDNDNYEKPTYDEDYEHDGYYPDQEDDHYDDPCDPCDHVDEDMDEDDEHDEYYDDEDNDKSSKDEEDKEEEEEEEDHPCDPCDYDEDMDEVEDHYKKPSYNEEEEEEEHDYDNEEETINHSGGSTEDLFFVVPLNRERHLSSDEMHATGVWCRNACNNVEWCKAYEYWPEEQRCELWTHWTGYTDDYSGYKCYVKTPCR